MWNWSPSEVREHARNIMDNLDSVTVDMLIKEIGNIRYEKRDGYFRSLLGNFTAAAAKLRQEFPNASIDHNFDCSECGIADNIDILDVVLIGQYEISKGE